MCAVTHERVDPILMATMPVTNCSLPATVEHLHSGLFRRVQYSSLSDAPRRFPHWILLPRDPVRNRPILNQPHRTASHTFVLCGRMRPHRLGMSMRLYLRQIGAPIL
ncbi:hypothetical protein PC116_g14661 [Phytophthora cactorum]|uniref:Uncharacterized protein n=1 Tax=Phytophthora cactorum TaxID=29920 RepID=A0A8T1KMH5_9STRA|nr:hypothetical protein Pcac1_g9062 [Phytophthora cactorum]KAG2904578.1 hypothetical protein PC114_g11804 [Phytophthora cactorum]KAG2937712.1 hypothetical protein PC117_g11569 [Phytophthora cactorum]KAG3016147.1 hypothetical protein PC119_g11444 [Phytophthora cactorum]KAG3165947.1 hypothetical protein C6341_g12201 [Phytophthora cactorum]